MWSLIFITKKELEKKVSVSECKFPQILEEVWKQMIKRRSAPRLKHTNF